MAGSKALRTVLLARLDGAVVSRSDIDLPDGLELDGQVLEALGLCEHEKVEVYNVSNGARFAAAVRSAPVGSKVVGVHGAAAQLASDGDRLTLSCFVALREKVARRHTPTTIALQAGNVLPERASAPAAPEIVKRKAKKSDLSSPPEKPAKAKKRSA